MGREEEALEVLTDAEVRDPDDDLLQNVRERFFAPEAVEQQE